MKGPSPVQKQNRRFGSQKKTWSRTAFWVHNKKKVARARRFVYTTKKLLFVLFLLLVSALSPVYFFGPTYEQTYYIRKPMQEQWDMLLESILKYFSTLKSVPKLSFVLQKTSVWTGLQCRKHVLGP